MIVATTFTVSTKADLGVHGLFNVEFSGQKTTTKPPDLCKPPYIFIVDIFLDFLKSGKFQQQQQQQKRRQRRRWQKTPFKIAKRFFFFADNRLTI